MVANSKGMKAVPKAVPKAESALNKSLPPELDALPEINDPFAAALSTLSALVDRAHSNMTELVSTLQPYLPQHMFASTGEGEAKASEPYYPTSGHQLSPTLIAVNIQLGELDRLLDRINYIRNNVVL